MATQTLAINPVGATFTDSDGNQNGVELAIDPANPLHLQLVSVAKDGTRTLFEEIEIPPPKRSAGRAKTRCRSSSTKGRPG
jgi:hypothetical protein